MPEAFENEIKFIAIGNCSAGKTSFIKKYIYNDFLGFYNSTIASEFDFKIIQKDKAFHRIQFWDLAGQDHSPALTGLFCRDSDGILVFCEATNKASLNDTLKWKKSLTDNGILEDKKIKLVLVESKSDLLNPEDIQLEKKNLERFAAENGFEKSFLVSSKSGEGIDDTMNYLIDEITQKLNKNGKSETFCETERNSFLLTDASFNTTVADDTKKHFNCC